MKISKTKLTDSEFCFHLTVSITNPVDGSRGTVRLYVQVGYIDYSYVKIANVKYQKADTKVT